MEILELIKNRRSVRSFKKDPIPEKYLLSLKEALIWAPSAGNLQSRFFYFVFNEQIKQKLAQAALNQKYIAEAPLVVVGGVDYKAVAKYGERGAKIFCQHDVAASIQNLLLLATELGLGTVWVGVFDSDKVAKLLKLPDHLFPVVLVPVGYAAKIPPAPSRIKPEAIKEIL